MNFSKYILYLTLAAVLLLSCHKSDSTVNPVVVNTGPDIYLAGYASYDHDTTHKSVAVYWKNNVVHKLTDSLTKSSASDIGIIGSNIYVAGSTSKLDGSSSSATYWVNGKANTIGYNNYATSMAIFGSDLYMAISGVSDRYIRESYFWTRGLTKVLTDSLSSSITGAIIVNNGDTYITGANSNNSSSAGMQACFWKNGVIIKLAAVGASNSSATAIAIQGADIYIAGYLQTPDGYQAVYWKNGVLTKLAADPNDAEAFAIAVKDNDVYVGGRLNGEGVYWKNGVSTVLNKGGVNSITIAGNDIYLAGSDNGQPSYWKNGTETKLTMADGNWDGAAALKILVVTP